MRKNIKKTTSIVLLMALCLASAPDLGMQSAITNVKAVTVDNQTFELNNLTYKIFDKSTKVIITGMVDTTVTEIIIPDTVDFDGRTFLVAQISDSAFEKNAALQSVTMGKNITSIGKKAFSECSSLYSVTLNEGLVSVGAGAFHNCTGLTQMTFPTTEIVKQNCNAYTDIFNNN